jgi:hypothetical protein
VTPRVLLLALLSTACATVKVIGPPVVATPDPNVQRVVVIEPFFEAADWQTATKTEYARMYGNGMGGYGMYGGMGMGPGQTVAIQRQVQEKPLYAQVGSLTQEHRTVLQEVQKLRPSWRVSSTSSLASLEGQVSIVRVIVRNSEMIESNRSFKNLAFGFGLFIWPLQLFNIQPVTETQRVYGALERYTTDAQTAKARLVRYQTQPDFAFNASGYTPLGRAFGLDLTYEEGLLADETPRRVVLPEGFAERLAAAIVALVEEPQQP